MDNFLGFIGMVVLVTVIWFVGAWIGMLLWNGCLVAAAPFFKPITTLQCGGLIILVGILTAGPGYVLGGSSK